MNKLKLMPILMIAMPYMMQASESENEQKSSEKIIISSLSENSKEESLNFIDSDNTFPAQLTEARKQYFIANALEFIEKAHRTTNHLIQAETEESRPSFNTFNRRFLDCFCCKKSHEQEKQEQNECKAALQAEATFLLQQALTTVKTIEVIERIS